MPRADFARLPKIQVSQLKAADAWGRRAGDHVCGPLAFYALLFGDGKTPAGLPQFKKFLAQHFPEFLHPTSAREFAKGIEWGDALERLRLAFPRELEGYRIYELNRQKENQDLFRRVGRLLEASRVHQRPVLLQVGAYFAKASGGANVWTRTLGHSLVLHGIETGGNDRDPLCEVRYWDPWDGREHRGVLYEELYRDFTALKPPLFRENIKRGRRLSPNGHRVLSPFLNLLAPHLDLYSNEVYFAQRYLYAVERALLLK